MSETIPTDPLAVANAIEIAETKLVGQIVRIARNPKIEPDAIRTQLEALDPADQIRIGDRVADVLQAQARRTGQFETLERALPFLPGQTSPAERQTLETAAQQQQPLGIDASIVHQALSRVLEDRQPNAADVPGLKDYAASAIKERERLDGPIVLPPEVQIIAGKPPPVHTMEQMATMVRQVQDRVPGSEDRLTTEQATEVRQSLEGQFAGARTLRDLNTLRWQEDVERSMTAVAQHPEQKRLMDAALEAAETRLMGDKLQSLASRQTPPEQVGAPAFTISRRGEGDSADTSQDPPGITSRYEVRSRNGETEYYQRDDGQLAMRANDERIQGILRDGRTISAMLDVAASRGWNDVQITGDRETARYTWIEATARGMQAEGYAPTREDRHLAEQRRVERSRGIETVRPIPEPSPIADKVERHNERAVSQDRGSRPGRAEGWTTQTQGYEGLSPQAKAGAERSYETWARANPELGARHGLGDYVTYVQQRAAEQREQTQPQRVEVPRREMRL